MSSPSNARQRMLRRRRRSVLIAILAVVGIVGGVSFAFSDDSTPTPNGDVAAASDPSSERPSPSVSPSSSPSPEPEPDDVVYEGDGTWTYVKPTSKKTIGDDGQLMKFNVAIEEGIDADPDEFTQLALETFADPRGWTAAEEWRFRMVDEGPADFTLYLASPATRRTLCGDGDDYTSCRNSDSVVINNERWVLGVPHWTDSMLDYRRYVINHEVGHRLGEGHVVCEKAGNPSPVMAQQTLDLGGCEPNAWPYVDGVYVTGPFGEYG